MSNYWAKKEARMAKTSGISVPAPKLEIPEELDIITDVVLAYRPKPKSKGAKRRVRRAKKAKADD